MGLFSGDMKTTASAETKKIHAEYGQLLVDGEIIDAAFTVQRDVFIFTNKRLILVEVQGISGRQIEYISIPYGRIAKFSVQTGENFDLNAELKIWTASETVPLEKKFNKDVNVYEVQKALAGRVLK